MHPDNGVLHSKHGELTLAERVSLLAAFYLPALHGTLEFPSRNDKPRLYAVRLRPCGVSDRNGSPVTDMVCVRGATRSLGTV
jgi:hypothetical protein